MKNAKKLFSLALVVVMVFALGISAAAAPVTYDITINSDITGHTYEAYQIFKGDLAQSTDPETEITTTILSNIEWGSGIDDVAFLAALSQVAGFETADTAAKVAEVLSGAANDSEIAKSFADLAGQFLATAQGTSSFSEGKYTISGLAAGYYLVKDADDSVSGEDFYTRFILQVVANTEASPKGEVPRVEKKVNEKNDSTDLADADPNWQDAADHDIGDKVEFQLTGTLPSNFADYQSYTYIFHDTLSAGLTLDEDSIVVTIDDAVIDPKGLTEAGYTVDFSPDDCSFEVAFANLRASESGGKPVTITAASKIVVTYTATLNSNAVIGSKGNTNEVYLEFSNNPNSGGDGDPGTTPPDVVIVFTYDLIVNKIDAEKKALEGAGFTLYKLVAGTYVEIEKFEAGADKTFTFAGLDEGKYMLEESETPAGYNTIEPIYFEIVSEYAAEGAPPALTGLSVVVYDKDGKVLSVEDGGAIFSASHTSGVISTDVVNNSGAQLPETGGIGTVIFRIVGAALIVFAGVMLVVKKRANKAAEG